jgi:hypothetical protein
MSNSLAIAAVTATLSHLLEEGANLDLPGTIVTAKPPEKARTDNGNQLNLFLYRTEVNGAWRNLDLPGQVKPGETGQPPLALNLHYLVTAYGQNDEDLLSHRLLGRAMSVLHDHPVLDAAEIAAALADNDLHEQLERVRITLQPLSLDDLSKLWMMAQTQYRISAAYQVAVVLIDSTRPVKTPLPVLTRGLNDEGVRSQPSLTPPFPTITALQFANQQPSARLGDELVIQGHHLDGAAIAVVVRHTRLELEPEVTILSRSDSEITVQLSGDPSLWAAGFYSLTVVVQSTEPPDRRTNAALFALAPLIQTIIPNPAARDANGDVQFTVTSSPAVRLNQRVALLLGDRELMAEPRPDASDPLVFIATDIAAEEYFVRLRVDGVDSLLIDRSVTPPIFDATQKVTIQ